MTKYAKEAALKTGAAVEIRLRIYRKILTGDDVWKTPDEIFIISGGNPRLARSLFMEEVAVSIGALIESL